MLVSREITGAKKDLLHTEGCALWGPRPQQSLSLAHLAVSIPGLCISGSKQLLLGNIPKRNEYVHTLFCYHLFCYVIQCNSYLHSIYIVLGIASNLEVIGSVWEDSLQTLAILYDRLEHPKSWTQSPRY